MSTFIPHTKAELLNGQKNMKTKEILIRANYKYSTPIPTKTGGKNY